jgi:hypothetical protein
MMLYIGFALRNPWVRRHQQVKEWIIAVSENKTMELGVYKDNSIIGVGFGITAGKRDHPGFNFDIQLAGYNLDFIFYDNRSYDERTIP